jgi:hypothetical protein
MVIGAIGSGPSGDLGPGARPVIGETVMGAGSAALSSGASTGWSCLRAAPASVVVVVGGRSGWRAVVVVVAGAG